MRPCISAPRRERDGTGRTASGPPRGRPRPLVLLLIAALAVGCGSGTGEERGGGAGPSDDGPGASRAADTAAVASRTGEDGPDSASSSAVELPSGGLEAWVSDLRDRLEEVELKPRTSYREVLTLYTTHHGFIHRYYGAGGVVTGDDHPELAEAVREQDRAFQELLELIGTTRYIERSHLLHAIRNVRMAVQGTLDEAREAGVTLDPLQEAR